MILSERERAELRSLLDIIDAADTQAAILRATAELRAWVDRAACVKNGRADGAPC